MPTFSGTLLSSPTPNDYSTSTDAFGDMSSESGYASSDYTNMATFVTAASRLIDLEMGRWPGFFYPTGDSVTKYYDGSGTEEQEIGEWTSLSSVGVSESGGLASSDYTSISSSDYITHPYNATANEKPITRLILDTLNSSTLYSFWRYRKSVKITGIAGYSTTVPETIAGACKLQAVRWFMRAKQGWQDTGATVEFGGMTFKGTSQLDPDIKAMLFPYKLELS